MKMMKGSTANERRGVSADSFSEKYLEEMRVRRTFWSGIILLIVAGLAMVYGVYAVVQFGDPAAWVSAGAIFLEILVTLAALYLARRGRSLLGAWMIILAFVITQPLLAALTPGLGLPISLVILIAVPILASQILPQSQVALATIIGIVASLAATLLSIFVAPRIGKAPEEIVTATPYIAGVLVLLLVLYVVLQFRSLLFISKFVTIFLMVSLLPGLGVGLIAQETTTRSITANVGESLFGLAQSQAGALADALSTQLDRLSANALSETVTSAAAEATNAHQGSEDEIASQIDALDKRWIAAISSGNTNDPLIADILANTVSTQLLRYQAAFPEQAEIFLTDRYGSLIGATNATSDYAQADEDWWQRAFNDGKGAIYISSPEFDTSISQLSLLMAVPVFDPSDGAVTGILRSTYRFSALSALLGLNNPGVSGESDLVYSTGGVKFHLHEGRIEPVEPEYQDVLARLAGAEYIFTDFEEVSSLVSEAPVRSFATLTSPYSQAISDLGMQVVVHQTSFEALTPVATQTEVIQLTLSIVMSLVSLIAVGIALLLSGPINRLSDVAGRISQGELSARAMIESRDEVGALASNFNEMTGQLQNTLDTLETRVQERTGELVLAADVGRTLSQQRDVNLLLREAVELIRSRFNLYYTQIYLTDPGGQSLILRAGTGAVGAELMRRAHRLSIGSGSINGMCANERRAIIVADTNISPLFRPNPLLPNTRSEMAVPLISGQRVVGVLDLQSDRPADLSEESLPAFQALAGQLAVAVDNAALFSEAEDARRILEERAATLVQGGWENYLDAISRPEVFGYRYESGEIRSISEANDLQQAGERQAPLALNSSLKVAGAEIGELSFERDRAVEWTQQERELVEAVALQVSQQIDSMRLLSQAESFRAEAEAAVRRATHEGWDEYLQGGAEQAAFTYAQHQVQPVEADLIDEMVDNAWVQPLLVRQERIGDLVVEGAADPDEDTQALIRTVAERLSFHLENLRLFSQTQVALSETQSLYKIIAEMNEARSYDQILDAMTDQTMLKRADQLLFMGVFDRPLSKTSRPDWIIPVAHRSPEAIKIAARYPVNSFEAKENTLFTDQPVVLQNLASDQRLDRVARTLFQSVFNATSSIIIPMLLGDQSIGFIQAYFKSPTEFSEQDIQRLSVIASQAAIAVQSRLLLEQATARARQEQRIREVTSQVYGASDVDSILRRAVEQVGKVLGLPAYIYLGDGAPGDAESK